MNPKKRLLSYDILRIIALLMIVMVHVSAYIVIFFPDTDKCEWLVGNIFNGIARAGVPLFILLSGALLLKEDKPVDAASFYKKNLLTMGCLTVFWMILYGLFYSLFLPLMEGKSASLSDFWGFIVSFKGSEYPHLWYMLMVVGMYLMIPVLRLFVKRENKSYIKGMIILSLLLQFGARTADLLTRGCTSGVSTFLAKFHLEPLTGFIGVLLVGWYLNEYTLKKKTRIVIYICGILSVTLSTLTVHFGIDTVPEIRDYVYSELSLPALIYGVALFVFVKTLCGGRATESRTAAVMSDSTFGVYLIHIVILEVFVRLILPYEKFGTGMPLQYIGILYPVTLLLSYAIVRPVGLIKGVRRIFYNR